METITCKNENCERTQSPCTLGRIFGITGREYIICYKDNETANNCSHAKPYGGSTAKPHGYYCKCPNRV